MRLKMKQKLYIPILAVLVLAGWLLAIGENPNRVNVISAEQEPLKQAVLPVSEAFTLALTRDASGQSIPLLVTALAEGKARAIDLSRQGAFKNTDLFEVIEDVGEPRLAELFEQAHAIGGSDLTQEYTFDQLLSVAGKIQRHIASGTNFREHFEETRSQSVFSFPKFGLPTPPVTTVNLHDGVLLDYEVELCMRFDRDLLTIQDFDAAQKGVFSAVTLPTVRFCRVWLMSITLILARGSAMQKAGLIFSQPGAYWLCRKSGKVSSMPSASSPYAMTRCAKIHKAAK